MSVWNESIRGDGLLRAQRVLVQLQEDPQQLDQDRQRFSHTPRSYKSSLSGTTTRSASPETEEQQRRRERRTQLGMEAEASTCNHQFSTQVTEEEERTWKAELNKTCRIPVGSDARTIASRTVKQRWVEQGIWSDKWNESARGRWKHEEPPELESVSGANGKVRQILAEQDREASRPYYQFFYQISKERERIQNDLVNEKGANPSPFEASHLETARINTSAYEVVKETWAKRGIWTERWGILPGMSWKHEWSDKEIFDTPASGPTSPIVNGSHDVGPVIPSQAEIISDIGSNNRQSPRTADRFLRGPSSNVDPIPPKTGLENGSPKRSPIANLPSPASGNRTLRRTTRQASLPSKRKAPRKVEQQELASHDPIHSSKISKAIGKRKGPQRRLISSPKMIPDADAPESQPPHSPDSAASRKSKRIQHLVDGKDIVDRESISLLNREGHSKLKRNSPSDSAARSSAKPQGISKKPPKKVLQRKTIRKKNS